MPSPPAPFTASRLLLNRLRQMMAGGGTARERLDKVVQLIAGTMVADVCSIYLRTSEDQLELVATEGLLAAAVGQTRLNVAEGLVGQIAMTARPLAVQDAPRHPAFSYRPETGEDPYHAFLGVPVLRGGIVIGVLVVQNRTERRFGDDEVETLQTIAMVVAEICANELIKADTGFAGLEVRPTRYKTLEGRVVCEGIGVGVARLHDVVVPPAKFFASDPGLEHRRLESALAELRLSLDRMLSSEGVTLWGEPKEVLESYMLLAQDPAWADRLAEGVRAGLTAEAAVDRARREHRARMEKAKDAYLRERLHDLEDLDNRLLRALAGAESGPSRVAREQNGEHFVLVARRLGAAELLEYRDAGLVGVVMEEAGASSHAAIVARALDIPTVAGVHHLVTNVEEGDQLIVDAETGAVHLRPTADTVASFQSRMAVRGQRRAEFESLKALPAETKDGQRVRLMLNAGLKLDLDQMDMVGAEGIGLFRTEFQFLVSDSLPRIDEQIDFYSRVLEQAGDRPVWFRTVDLGGDKILPGMEAPREENPAMGWRSVRLALDNVGLFRRQIRALVRAAAEKPLSIMFPMVTVAGEFLQARALVRKELDWSRKQGHALPSSVRVGTMLEVPALVWGLDALKGQVDFISLGTNDLMQFFFAADRNTPQLAERYDMLQAPALRFLAEVQARCAALDVPVSVCGEATGRPLEALALIALGFRRLSMPAGGIGPVKRLVRSIDLGAFSRDFHERLAGWNGSFRNEILALARHHDLHL